MGGAVLRAIPADFATYAAVEGDHRLAKRYAAGVRIVRRWRAESGARNLRAGASGPVAKPIPADFAERHEIHTIRALAAHYDVGRETIRRWLRETGVRRGRGYRPVGDILREAKPRVGKHKSARPSTGNRTEQHIERDASPAGLAADFLRRLGPVYRCDLHGKPIPNGSFWRRGNAVLTDGELMERAAFKGWAGLTGGLAA